MSAFVRRGAAMLGVMLAFAWPAAPAQDRHGQGGGHGRGQGYGGPDHGGRHQGGQYRGGQYHGGQFHDGGARFAGPPHWRGDFGRYRGNDWGDRRGGYWHHGHHGGRLGWWWVVGPTWYYYPEPVYPYPGPWTAPAQYWYYCPATRLYYPFVPACPGWQQLPVVPDTAVLVPIPQVP